MAAGSRSCSAEWQTTPNWRSFPWERSGRTDFSRAGASIPRRSRASPSRSGFRVWSSRSSSGRVSDGAYELIAGERRWRAAKAAGLATIPSLVRPTDDRDSLLLALVENVAREDLSPIEEARAYAVLQDEFALSLGDVAERVGRSKPSVSNRIRLLDLPDDVLGLVERGLLSEGHARAVLAVPDHEERRKLARRIVKQGLSVRAAERAARWAGASTKRRMAGRVDPDLAARAQRALEQLTGAGVRIGSRRIEIDFRDETELAEIVEALETLAQTPAA